MSARHLLPLALGALAGCAVPGSSSVPACTTDRQCGAGQLCFAEGCGDPGTGIVVEVSGDPLASQYPRDFPVADGTLGPSHDFDLGPAIGLSGAFQREATATPDPATRITYAAPVVVRAVGQSEFLPGVSRVYEQRIDAAAAAGWEMHLGAGRYSVTAVPVDPAVPPATVTGQAVRTGAAPPAVDFVFPALDGALPVSGRLLDAVDATVQPATEVAITQGAMDLQAFDPGTLLPLSQRFPVSSGQPGSNGNFAMTLRPEARQLPAVLFRATPRDSSAPMPSKDFVVDTPLPDPLTLALGGPGAAVPVTGTALGPDGRPVGGAQVVISGVVAGGGTYRSRIAVTGATGAFELQSLPGREPLSLTVVPPPGSPAAVTTRPVVVAAQTGATVEVRCDRRVRLGGTVLTPSGLPAGGVAVTASEHAEPGTDSRPLPLEPSTAVAGQTGHFELALDPGTWRLEFSASGLPTLSRLVTVPAPVDALGLPVLTTTIGAPVRLSPGRTISGTVTGDRGLKAGAPIPWATVRFFRVGPIDGVDTAILLGGAVADDKGHYSVVLPGR